LTSSVVLVNCQFKKRLTLKIMLKNLTIFKLYTQTPNVIPRRTSYGTAACIYLKNFPSEYRARRWIIEVPSTGTDLFSCQSRWIS
jgi:hypothetical protein